MTKFDTLQKRCRGILTNMFLLCLFSMAMLQAGAQTTLVSATGDGGFETGSTLAANGWTGVTSGQTWFVGTSAVTAPSAGTNMAYTSTTSGSWTPGTAASVAHIYRDITIPGGETLLTVTVKYKTLAVDATFDFLKVHVVPTTTTPVGGTQLATGQIGVNTDGTTAYATYTFSGTVSTGSQRLVISFKTDAVSPFGAAAIDEVSVVSATPPSPLSGTYTINNTLTTSGLNYASFTDAINALNLVGVSGPVIFDVSAGQTFTEAPPAITATGTVSNTITFQKSGVGSNPVLVRVTGTSSSTDFGFCISGGDYFTFDGIDVNSSTATTSTLNLEFGYLLRNATATNGAQFNTIRNCAITLNRNFVGSSSSGCIYTSVSSSQGGVVPANATGANSNNKFYNLTLTNAQNGVFLVGNTSFPDLNNEVGVAGSGCQVARNSITNMGGVTTFNSAYGVRAEAQSGVKVFNNNISSIRSNQSVGAGILLINYQGTCEVYNNNVTDGANSGSTTSTSRFAGIELQNSSGTHTARVYNNTVSNIASPYTSTATASIYAYGIFANNTSTANIVEVDNNSVNLAPSGTITYSNACFANASSSAVQRVRGNIFVNATNAQTGVARHWCWKSTSNTTIGASTSVSNYNDLFVVNDAGTSGFVGGGSSSNYTTVANWSAAITSPAGTDANSISVNPGFTSSSDLHASAAAIDAVSGFTVQSWVTTDIDCETRSALTPHDLGADAVAGCSGSPAGGTISPGAASRCVGQTYAMTAASATAGPGISYQWEVSTTGGGLGFGNVVGGSGATTVSYTTGTLTAGTYYYRLAVTCSSGPSTAYSNELVLTVNALPNITINPSATAYCAPGDAPISLTASGASTYTWAGTGTPNLSAASGNPITASPSSNTTITATGTDANGCVNTGTVALTSSASVVMNSVSATPSNVCSGSNSQLAADAIVYSATASGMVYEAGTGVSFETITSPTTVTTVTSGTVDDGAIAVTPSPAFTFTYAGTNSTTFGVGTNGYVVFGSTSTSIPSSVTSLTGLNVAFAFGRDANLNVTNAGSITHGPAADGKYVFQFNKNSGGSGGGESSTIFANYQIVLWGNSSTSPGRVEIIYGTSSGTPGTSGTIGIRDAAGNFINGVNGSTSLTTTAAAWPASGTRYRFSNPAPAGFAWSPATNLNSTSIANPLASNVTAPITYNVTATQGSCSANGSVSLTVQTGTTYYQDIDADTYGNPNVTQTSCTGAPSGYVADNTDCDDNNAAVNPGATEICNGIDDDCDGSTDEGVTTTFYADADGDTYGDAGSTTQACSAPSGYVADNTDCNDANAAVNPGATEVCNGIDDDCDGSTDEGVTTTFYADADGDTYGDAGSTTQACSAPSGYVADNTDCNDGNAAVNPGATEVCNGIDDDCDGSTDEGVTTTFYADADMDGQGNPGVSQQACTAPSGYVTNNTDCDDAVASNLPPSTPAAVSFSPNRRNLCNESSVTITMSSDPNATSYTWTVPSGLSGTSTTNVMTANVTGTFGQAVFTVTANNGCGSSAVRNVSVWGTPTKPNVSGPVCATNPQSGLVYTVTNAEPGVTYNWQVPNGVTIQSQTATSITVDWMRINPAKIKVVGSNACGNSPVGSINVSICPPQIAGVGKSTVLVYPNPTNGNTNVLLTLAKETKVAIVVYDMAGKQLQRKEVVAMAGQNRIGLDMGSYPNGMYLVSVISADGVQTVKVVKGL